jgi:iron complex transport system permease protein
MSPVRMGIVMLVAALIIACSVFLGPRIIPPFSLSETDREILLSIRMPRVIVAFLMGMALGASGAVLQGVLRNPLADSYILGISSGASLTAALGIIGGLTFLGAFTIPVLAFIGAVATGGIVGVMGWKRGGLWPERLLLAGVGLSSLFSALLSMSEWRRVPYGLAFVLAGVVLSTARAKALNALILGDDFAHSLGFDPHRERFAFFVSVGLMTAASVSLGGMIGFIGLLVPHIMRFFIGSDSKVLVPASALGGGALLCIADLISRSVLPPMELPAGVVTAIIGVPYFLYLLRRKDVLSF